MALTEAQQANLDRLMESIQGEPSYRGSGTTESYAPGTTGSQVYTDDWYTSRGLPVPTLPADQTGLRSYTAQEWERMTPQQRTAFTQTAGPLQTGPTGQVMTPQAGSWQGTGASPYGVWVPGPAGFGTNRNVDTSGYLQMYRDLSRGTPEFSGLEQFMTGQMIPRGSQTQRVGTAVGAQPPAVSGRGPMYDAMQQFNWLRNVGQAASPTAPQGAQDMYRNFTNWWTGQNPWEQTMMDYTGLAPFDPVTGQNLGGPTDIGALYNRFRIGTPARGVGGTSYLPGMPTHQFQNALMQNNPGLFISSLQQNQLMQDLGLMPRGPISPWVSPEAARGLGGFTAEQALGGQYSPGQQAALGGVNPATGAYGGLGIHQGAGGFGGGAGSNVPYGPDVQMQQTPTFGIDPLQGFVGGRTRGSNTGGFGGWPPQDFPDPFGGGFGGFGGGFPGFFGGGGNLSGNFGGLSGVASLLGLVNQLRGGFGGVGNFTPRRPPLNAFGRSGNMFYPSYSQTSMGNPNWSGGGYNSARPINIGSY